MAAAVRGDGDAVITNLPLLARFEAGQSLRLLATFTKDGTRPDVPNATRARPAAQLADIVGGAHRRGARRTCPPTSRRILVEAIDKAVNDPAVVALSEKAGMGLALQSPDEVAADVHAQANFFDKWRKYLVPN